MPPPRVHDLHAQVHRLAEGESQARRLRDGFLVVVAGAPNVGKSSVFNALVGHDRAIVTPAAGTTRDLVTEHALVGNTHLQVVDTAGVRRAADVVEQEGIRRARAVTADADLVLVVLDRSRPLGDDDRAVLDATSGQARIVVANKADLPSAWGEAGHDATLLVSAAAGSGIAALTGQLSAHADAATTASDLLVTNERQRAHLRDARAHLAHACEALDRLAGEVPEEFLVADLVRARQALDELTGTSAAPDILAEIFNRFCIGK